ncbi:MAG: hypothetical protein RBU21_23840 [FCB group bacterium]|nr:hypothetical protein [FCB group bacterium]
MDFNVAACLTPNSEEQLMVAFHEQKHTAYLLAIASLYAGSSSNIMGHVKQSRRCLSKREGRRIDEPPS